MGLVATKRIKELRKTGYFLIGFSAFIPIINALVGILIAKVLGFEQGNALLDFLQKSGKGEGGKGKRIIFPLTFHLFPTFEENFLIYARYL
jgi:hypothetical protein